MPPNPPSNAHGFAMRSMSLRDMQITESEKKKFFAPPLPNPGNAPDVEGQSLTEAVMLHNAHHDCIMSPNCHCMCPKLYLLLHVIQF